MINNRAICQTLYLKACKNRSKELSKQLMDDPSNDLLIYGLRQNREDYHIMAKSFFENNMRQMFWEARHG